MTSSMNFGPITKRLRESACVAPAPSFVAHQKDPSEEYKFEVSVVYPFVGLRRSQLLRIRTGKFGTAVKAVLLLVTHKNEVCADVFSPPAPRCAKVFDFGKHIPDPYTAARVSSADSYSSLENRTSFGIASIRRC